MSCAAWVMYNSFPSRHVPRGLLRVDVRMRIRREKQKHRDDLYYQGLLEYKNTGVSQDFVMEKKVRDYFENKRDEITGTTIGILENLVRQKTVNVIPEKLTEHPYLETRGEEWKVAGIVENWFKEWGIEYEIHEREKGRTNIIGRLGRKKPGGKKLLMAAHLDVVPAGKGWSTDPFEPVVKEGKIFGRGVLDNKGPMVSAMMAGRAIKELGLEDQMSGELLIAGLADEEASGEQDCGIGFLLDENLIEPTHAIIPDVGENMAKIDVAEKGRVVIRVISRGRQAHGSTPDRGFNAIFPMARFLALAEKLDLEYEEHPLLGGWTMNLGEIRGGAAANIVPGECSADFDFRLVPGQTQQEIINKFTDFAGRVDGEFEIVAQSSTTPHAIDIDNVLVRSIQRNAETVLGFTPVPYGLGGGTFAKTLNQHGIIAVGFGPGDDTAFHVSDEFVEIKQLVDFACLISLVTMDILAQ